MRYVEGIIQTVLGFILTIVSGGIFFLYRKADNAEKKATEASARIENIDRELKSLGKNMDDRLENIQKDVREIRRYVIEKKDE